VAAIHKPLVWLRGEVKTPPFSQAARVEAGVLLRQLQGGAKLGLPHSRPMPGIGARCHEYASWTKGRHGGSFIASMLMQS
jgi:hypothetical protein